MLTVTKEGKYLICNVENKICKYDLSTGETIGFSGKVVKSLSSQLKGVSIRAFINAIDDDGYKRFIKQVHDSSRFRGSSIAGLLKEVAEYSYLEQFSILDISLEYALRRERIEVKDLPKPLLKYAKDSVGHTTIGKGLLMLFTVYPNIMQIIDEMELTTITKNEIISILTYDYNCYRYADVSVPTAFLNELRLSEKVKELYWHYRDTLNVAPVSLILHYNKFNLKQLISYLDKIATYEAIDVNRSFINDYLDYYSQMKSITAKVDRYPNNFLTTKRIASRNYDRFSVIYDEIAYAKNCYNPSMEYTRDGYTIIYPKTTQDIKDEGARMHHCVASYVNSVMDGKCDIMFLRYAEHPEEPLVTLEVRNGKVVQARRAYNVAPSREETDFIAKYERFLERKFKLGIDETEEVC